MSWPWDDLGLDGPSSLNEVRRAYAQRLKDVHPEEDPEGFQQLHAAYQKARQLARQAQRGESSAPWNPQPPRPRPAQPDQASAPEEASGPDFTALLEQESTQAPPQPESPESKFDFDDLLNQPQAQEEAPREQQKQQDESWDFQRLLHEEAAQKTDTKHPGGGQKPPKQQAKQPRSRQRRPGLVILAVVLGIFFLLPAAIGLGAYLSGLSDRQSANRISQYIEEDLGYPVELQYADQSQMLFYLPSRHKSFTAWPEGERERYRSILERCDYETLVQHHYDRFCMMRRNRYMVDRSARLLAVYDGVPQGGTAQTLAYALRKGLHVTLLELE